MQFGLCPDTRPVIRIGVGVGDDIIWSCIDHSMSVSIMHGWFFVWEKAMGLLILFALLCYVIVSADHRTLRAVLLDRSRLSSSLSLARRAHSCTFAASFHPK